MAIAEVSAAIASPGIVAATALYMFVLVPVVKASGLVDKTKGAYRRAMLAYNVIFSIYSALTFVVTAAALGWDRGYGQWLRDLTGDTVVSLYQDKCPSTLFNSKLFMWAAWAFYYSKFVEFLDTVWLVLKGKPASFLQKLHHSGAPWDLYFQLVLQHEGVWIFVSFNSFIHTFMYAYYAITAVGIKCPAKSLITMMQISQFIIGFVAVYRYASIPCYYASKGLMFAWYFNYAYVGAILLLFLHFFYVDNFVPKARLKEKGK